MALFTFLPLLLIPYILYIGLYYAGIFPAYIGVELFRITLPSGFPWIASYGDILIILGIFLLFFELYKATHTSTTSIVDHIFSTFVLIAYLVTWLIFPFAANSYFLILTLMSFLDVIAGFTITISGARRDLGLGDK